MRTLFSRSVFTELCAAKLHCCEIFIGVEVKKSSQVRYVRQWLNRGTRLRNCRTCQNFYMVRNFVISKEDLGVCMYVYEVFPRLIWSKDPFTAEWVPSILRNTL